MKDGVVVENKKHTPIDTKEEFVENEIPSGLVVEINDQIYFKAQTNIMTLYIPTNISMSPTVEKTDKIPTVQWLIPKPPVSFLTMFFRQAAEVYNKMNSEFEVFILWDTVKKKHIYYIPKQEVSSAAVTFNWTIPDNTVLMFELHSHHVMSITFSGTDDANDSSIDILPHISAVVKNINAVNMLDYNKNVDVRLSYLSNTIDLTVEDIFEFESFDLSVVTKPTPARSIANTFTPDGFYRPAQFRRAHQMQYLRTFDKEYLDDDVLQELADSWDDDAPIHSAKLPTNHEVLQKINNVLSKKNK